MTPLNRQKFILSWQKIILFSNTPGTAGGPGGREQTLAVKSRKTLENLLFLVQKLKLPKTIFFFCIYLLVMPKYWGKPIFTHGSFPKVGQKHNMERERKTESR